MFKNWMEHWRKAQPEHDEFITPAYDWIKSYDL